MIYSSGNKITDRIGELNISGNVTPAIWYRNITRDNGKPYLLAIAILSDIVYWYRPAEVRDESTGQLLGWRKKFKSDLLCKTYQNYADFFGESKRSVKAAMDRLEELKLIKRVFRDEIHDGQKFINVMYISLNPDMVYNITFTDFIASQDAETDLNETESDGTGYKDLRVDSSDLQMCDYEYVEKVPENDAEDTIPHPPTKFCTTPLQNNVIPPTKFCTTLLQNNVPPSYKILYDPPTEFCNFTKNTTKNTTKNINQSINQDKLDDKYTGGLIEDVLIQKIKNKLEYDLRMTTQESGLSDKQKIFGEVCNVIFDVIRAKGNSYNINGIRHSYEDVCNRLLSLDYEHIIYAASQVIESNVPVTNMRQYLIAALYNSLGTMQLAMKKDIHDKFGYG